MCGLLYIAFVIHNLNVVNATKRNVPPPLAHATLADSFSGSKARNGRYKKTHVDKQVLDVVRERGGLASCDLRVTRMRGAVNGLTHLGMTVRVTALFVVGGPRSLWAPA
jgi:hypothetical protein